MVVSEINSGLGNQMFQYAAGKALADHLKTNLLLDTTWYDDSIQAQTPRNFELNVYPIQGNLANQEIVDQLIRPSSNGLLNKLKHQLNRRRAIHKQWAFIEPHFHFYSKFFEASSPIYLSGYWQSEKYFLPIADQIRQTFTIEISIQEACFKTFKTIQSSTNSVSIHVRRGDMVKNPDVAKIHGSCNLDYYLRCMKKVEERIKSPEYFVFSDDPLWCKQNLQSNFPIHFVSDNYAEKSYLDIQLMRQCKHHIIANSSFSWWGAWLNPNPDKIVIAPLNWFAHSEHNTSDLIPSSWLRF